MKGIVTRKSFTAEQLAEAERLGFVHPATPRRRAVTHPIDNVTPDILSDRDDGIYVEAGPAGDGGCRVEVTIADVAGHVPLSSPLAAVGQERAFTVYRPESNDPMFPKPLEERMSLEHGQDRYGLTVVTERDARYQPHYLEFQRTLVAPDNTDYAMAEARMRSDPEFALMRDIAGGMRREIKRHASAALEEIKQERGRTALEGQALEARKVVETYMLVTNEDVAGFMLKAKLPFIYRNFHADQPDESGVSRAYYSTRQKGHDALAREGFVNPYCHFTSPIRRGPDFFNAHMVHFVIDGIEQLEEALAAGASAAARQKLHRALWRHGPDLFAAQERVAGGHALRSISALAAQCVKEAGLPPKTLERPETQDALRLFAHAQPPLTVSQLERHCRSINILNRQEQIALSSPELQRWIATEDDRAELKLELARMQHVDWQALEENKLSSLLRRAAVCGLMTPPLKEELLRRMAAYLHAQGEYKQFLPDALSILIVSSDPTNPDWRDLKKAVCRTLKDNPSAVNSLFDMAVQDAYLSPDSVHLSALNLSLDETRIPTADNTMEAAVITFRNPSGVLVAAPFYSVGHNRRYSESHAKYSFLEHYAFGQLRPIDQAAIPNLLYADLDHAGADRQAILSQLAESIGAQFRLVANRDRQGVEHATAIIKGGKLHAPIVAHADSRDDEEIRSLAMKRLLRMDAFKNEFRYRLPPAAQALLKPYEHLQQELAAQQIECDYEVAKHQLRGGRSKFTVAVTTTENGKASQFSGTGPNIDRALHEAATAALEHYGLSAASQLPSGLQSWTIFEKPLGAERAAR